MQMQTDLLVDTDLLIDVVKKNENARLELFRQALVGLAEVVQDSRKTINHIFGELGKPQKVREFSTAQIDQALEKGTVANLRQKYTHK